MAISFSRASLLIGVCSPIVIHAPICEPSRAEQEKTNTGRHVGPEISSHSSTRIVFSNSALVALLNLIKSSTAFPGPVQRADPRVEPHLSYLSSSRWPSPERFDPALILSASCAPLASSPYGCCPH
ncbi:hypothetical protein IWZ01DRAFT_514826 [Phyllosticta capitalensis]